MPKFAPAIAPAEGAASRQADDVLLADGASLLPARERLRLSAPSQTRARLSEIGLAGVALALLALVMCTGHVLHGGLYYDDWSLLALGRFPPPGGGLLHGLWLYYGQRPGQVLYYAALQETLGAHVSLRLGLAAVAVVAQATVLYTLLRRVGLQAREALACAALSLAFPFSDSVWLWGVLSLASLAIAASLLGVVLALRALQSSGSRSLALHAGSLALYVAGVLSYEIFAVAGCLAGLLYVRAVGFARARKRWALDFLAIAAAALLTRLLLPIDIATPSRAQSLAGTLRHAALIAVAGARTAGAAILPVSGLSAWVGVGVLAAIASLAVLVRRKLAHGDPARRQLDRFFPLALGGLLVASAGWAVYAPAPDHYLPSSVGTVNRVNALAAIGLALLVYSSLALLTVMVVRLARLPEGAAAVAAVGLAALLCIAYVHRSAADVRYWDRAARDQRSVVAGIRGALADPPRGALIFAFDAPLTVGPGVPVLNTRLDLASALRVAYANPSLDAVPLARVGDLRCTSAGPAALGAIGSYGRSYLLDVRARHEAPLASASRCNEALASALSAHASSARR